MKYLLGIDFGGGASKATLIHQGGDIVAENTVEYATYHPTPGSAEQDPADWIAALKENTRVILRKSGIRASDIAAIAVDSATHTFLVTDEQGVPLRHAIHWTDTRSRTQANALREQYGEEIFKKTYHKPDTIWTLPMLVWLKENEPDVFSRIARLYFEKDYIREYLTGVFATDCIEAEGSMLYDCERGCFDEWLCSLAGIKPDVLAPIGRPTDIIGGVTAAAAHATGLSEGTPVVMGTTDTVMEVFASGAVSCGDMTVKLATAGRICVITEGPKPDRHLVNYSHIVDGLWYPGTATKAAAASYRWYRDTFGGEYRALDEAAEKIPIGAEGLFFHPYLLGELTPYADPTLKASFTGVGAEHTRAHFTRAVLEGVAFSLMDCKAYLDSLGIPHKDRATLIGGGAKGRLWQSIVADALGITLVTTESSDSSLGSAMLAGIAVGIFENAQDAVNKCVKKKDTVYPNPENTGKYRALYKSYKEIHDALAPIYNKK